MRIPNEAHQAHPWLIGEIASDFALLDVWALPAAGGPNDFGRLVELFATMDPAKAASPVSRALFWVRFRLGELFGWDEPGQPLSIPGCAETSLAERLPEHLRGSAAGFEAVAGFSALYRTDTEAAAEISNATVHGVLHLGWVDDGHGRYRGRLAVYVKPRGALGRAYLAAIAPFRHLIVYPALLRSVERAWQARTD